jgi:ABC-2 type transport system permease protein
VDADQYAAAVIVPDGFSESILPAGVVSGDFTQRPDSGDSTVLIYANPSRPVSTNIIHSIVDTILTRISGAKAGVIVSIAQLIETERITPQEAFSQGEKLVSESSRSTDTTGKIQVSSRLIAPDTNDTGETGEFDFLRYTAPSMAILYLMFTMTNAGRSILTEREHGTLPRMLISPTSRAEVLAGKMLGVFATGLLQMTVVIVAGSYIFNMSWGHWLPLSLLTLALVAAASGWGILIAAYSKTPGQAGTVGAAVNLTFAALAGNFLPRMAYPHWMQTLSLVTPNAWGIDYYYKLIYGAQLLDVLPAILVLSGMAVLMFLLAILAFQRQVKI